MLGRYAEKHIYTLSRPWHVAVFSVRLARPHVAGTSQKLRGASLLGYVPRRVRTILRGSPPYAKNPMERVHPNTNTYVMPRKAKLNPLRREDRSSYTEPLPHHTLTRMHGQTGCKQEANIDPRMNFSPSGCPAVATSPAGKGRTHEDYNLEAVWPP